MAMRSRTRQRRRAWRYVSPSAGEARVVRLFVRHRVADHAAWREGCAELGGERRPTGVVAHAVYQAIDGPSDSTAWHDFATRDGCKSRRFAVRKSRREMSLSDQHGALPEPIGMAHKREGGFEG